MKRIDEGKERGKRREKSGERDRKEKECHFFLCLDNIVLVDAGSYLDNFFLFFLKIFYFLKTLKNFYWEIFTFKEIFF